MPGFAPIAARPTAAELAAAIARPPAPRQAVAPPPPAAALVAPLAVAVAQRGPPLWVDMPTLLPPPPRASNTRALHRGPLAIAAASSPNNGRRQPRDDEPGVPAARGFGFGFRCCDCLYWSDQFARDEPGRPWLVREGQWEIAAGALQTSTSNARIDCQALPPEEDGQTAYVVTIRLTAAAAGDRQRLFVNNGAHCAEVEWGPAGKRGWLRLYEGDRLRAAAAYGPAIGSASPCYLRVSVRSTYIAADLSDTPDHTPGSPFAGGIDQIACRAAPTSARCGVGTAAIAAAVQFDEFRLVRHFDTDPGCAYHLPTCAYWRDPFDRATGAPGDAYTIHSGTWAIAGDVLTVAGSGRIEPRLPDLAEKDLAVTVLGDADSYWGSTVRLYGDYRDAANYVVGELTTGTGAVGDRWGRFRFFVAAGGTETQYGRDVFYPNELPTLSMMLALTRDGVSFRLNGASGIVVGSTDRAPTARTVLLETTGGGTHNFTDLTVDHGRTFLEGTAYADLCGLDHATWCPACTAAAPRTVRLQFAGIGNNQPGAACPATLTVDCTPAQWTYGQTPADCTWRGSFQIVSSGVPIDYEVTYSHAAGAGSLGQSVVVKPVGGNNMAAFGRTIAGWTGDCSLLAGDLPRAPYTGDPCAAYHCDWCNATCAVELLT